MNKHRSNQGFFKIYIAVIFSLVLFAFAAHFIGTRLTTRIDEIERKTNEPYDRYEYAGIDADTLYRDLGGVQTDTGQTRNDSDRYTNSSYDPYDLDHISIEPDPNLRPPATTGGNSAGTNNNPSGAINANNINAPQLSGQNNPALTGSGSLNDNDDNGTAIGAPGEFETFTSKINTKVSFEYPADSRVSEARAGDGIAFTVTDSNGRRISIAYDKDAGGCFDPIRSFLVDPNSAMDFRLLYPRKDITVDSKYPAMRSDEENGRFIYAGNDATSPLIFVSNICVQTAIPTRIRISSSEYKMGDKANMIKVIDGLMAKLTL